MQNQGQGTGTRNETYDVISVLYHALQGAEQCQIYTQDAKEGEARDFLQHAMQTQRQLADKGKKVLENCLQKSSGDQGQSAFGWGQNTASGQGGSMNQGGSMSQGQSGSSQSNLESAGSGQNSGSSR